MVVFFMDGDEVFCERYCREYVRDFCGHGFSGGKEMFR